MVRRVIGLGIWVEDEDIAGVLDVVPAFASLMIHFDPDVVEMVDLSRLLDEKIRSAQVEEIESGPVLDIPVCYHPSAAPDLAELARHCGMSQEEVVQRHSASAFRVYMLGFIPGFVYLGGMDDALSCPRRASPRVSVPKGSIGIAGNQTGIYSLESPGGWQIIGRTPISLFELNRDPPFWAKHMQEIRFTPISMDELEGWPQ
jgi:KipI family sensor histidine kinase inhibitor